MDFHKKEKSYCHWPKTQHRKFIKKAESYERDWDVWPVNILLDNPGMFVYYV